MITVAVHEDMLKFRKFLLYFRVVFGWPGRATEHDSDLYVESRRSAAVLGEMLRYGAGARHPGRAICNFRTEREIPCRRFGTRRSQWR